MAYIVEEIRFSDLRRALPERIYFGTSTRWWTGDPAHLFVRHDDSGLPCDPLGGVLVETDDPAGFLDAAEADPAQFGPHGLRAFMAAHHLNCRVSFDDPRPAFLRTWDEVNAALDAQSASYPLKSLAINSLAARPCDPEIYASGQPVFVSQSLSTEAMERWVKKVAAHSGQSVDWHFYRGRARVLAVGDLYAINEAIRALLPEHNELQRQALEAKGLPFYPAYDFPGGL